MGVCVFFQSVIVTLQKTMRSGGGIFSLKTTAAVLWPETTRPGRRFLLVWVCALGVKNKGVTFFKYVWFL